MSKLAYISHPIYLKHDTGLYHPESPKRLIAIDKHLKNSSILSKIKLLQPNPANEDIISLAHDKSYIHKIKTLIEDGEKLLDYGDTVVGEFSYEAALYAAGAVVQGINLLNSGYYDKVFCAVRPPGHHAEYNQARGFCFINNIAVAAKYAQHIGFAKKILIVDWDVHHGNGTQDIFYEDDSVFYYSLHQYPYFPGSGSGTEIGLNKGKGFTFNRPMRSGSRDIDYLNVFEKDINFIENKFKPELILISAGFDAHKDDPLAGIMLSENCFIQMTEKTAKLAWKYCDGKILSVLEGGYNLNVLASCVESHLEVLLRH